MLDKKVVQRISNITLEDAVKELELIAQTMTSTSSHEWFKLYEAMYYDKRSFEIIGLPKAYYGNEEKSVEELADARIKLLSFYELTGSA